MKIFKSLSVLIVVLAAFLVVCDDAQSKKPERISVTKSPDGTTKGKHDGRGHEMNVAASPVEVRAVSLRVLQEKLRACHQRSPCPKELLHLGGLNRVTGYVVDTASHDLILIGHTDPNLPFLYLEDFVVALRSAWRKYASLKGNVSYYSAPGCSIDPPRQVLEKLQVLGQQLLSHASPAGTEKGIQDWHRICQALQEVTVLGIPFDTHFAHVMVAADYHMKSVVDGSDSLGLPVFTSLTAMTLERIKSDIVQGRPVSVPMSSMNRFWFFPGENRYEEAPGIVWIKRSQVALLTEEEALDKGRRIVGHGRANALAQHFAAKFTARYIEVARQRRIYTELENLFRFVALAQIIKMKSPHTEAGLDVIYLLEGYKVPNTSVPKQLPGRSAVQNFQHRRDVPGGYQLASVQLPSCGGVSIDIEPKPEHFQKDTSGNLAAEKSAVLSSRPAHDTLFWQVPVPGIAISQRVREINQTNNNIAFYTVENQFPQYVVHGEHDVKYDVRYDVEPDTR